MTRSHSSWIDGGHAVENWQALRYAESCMSWQRGDKPRVLVACERSGRVRDWLRIAGIDAWSCDVKPCDVGGPHLQGDVFSYVGDGWDVLIAFPPCTYLSRVNVAYRRKHPELELAARDFVARLWALPISRVLIENRVGAAWQVLGKPHQQVQPWHFGDPYTKRTCLWFRGLSPLRSASSMGTKHLQSWCSVRYGSKGRSETFHGIAGGVADSVVRSLATWQPGDTPQPAR